ncbi:hypothetical protein D9M71_762220 [compost metagenome]
MWLGNLNGCTGFLSFGSDFICAADFLRVFCCAKHRIGLVVVAIFIGGDPFYNSTYRERFEPSLPFLAMQVSP